jgi:hypothetical protein
MPQASSLQGSNMFMRHISIPTDLSQLLDQEIKPTARGTPSDSCPRCSNNLDNYARIIKIQSQKYTTHQCTTATRWRPLSSPEPLDSLINITQIPDSVNTTELAYTGNEGSIMSKAPPIMGAIMPPLSVWQGQNLTHAHRDSRDVHSRERSRCATGCSAD